MPPTLWECHEDLLVIKFISTSSTEEMFQAVTEARESDQFQKCSKALLDARSSFDHVMPDVQSRRLQFISDSLKDRVVRCAFVSTPHSMVKIVEEAAARCSTLGLNSRAFTDIDVAFAWLESPPSPFSLPGS